MDAFLYHLYGMYLAILAEPEAACHCKRDNLGCTLFPHALQLGVRGRYPWANLFGPLPGLPRAPPLCMRTGTQPGWPRWEPTFAHDLVHWARALASHLGPDDVSWVNLAWTMRSSWGRSSQCPRTTSRGGHASLWGGGGGGLGAATGGAVGAMAHGSMLATVGSAHQPVPLPPPAAWARLSRAAGTPLSAARQEMVPQLLHLASHCQDMWLRQLRAVPVSDRRGRGLLMGYFPRPPKGE